MSKTLRAAGLEALVFLSLVTPLLSAPFFLSIDGPAHLAIAVVTLDLLLDPASDFARLYALNHGLHPNLLAYQLLAGLAALLSPLAAEKALLCTMAELLWLATHYCFSAFPVDTRGARWLALAIFFNATLHRLL